MQNAMNTYGQPGSKWLQLGMTILPLIFAKTVLAPSIFMVQGGDGSYLAVLSKFTNNNWLQKKLHYS